MAYGNNWIWQDVEKHITSGNGILILLGPSGVGKTYNTKAICRQHDIDVFVIDSCNCASGKEMSDLLQKRTTSRIVQALSQSWKRACIIIDELETLLQYDRSIMNDVVQYAKSTVPIICIGHKSLEKKITNTLSAPLYMCNGLTESDICIWLKLCYTNVPCDKIVVIAEKCEGNMHYARQLLNDVSQTKDTTYVFHDIYNTTSMDNVRKILHEDPWLHPLKFHENLPKDLNQRKATKEEKQNMYFSALQHMINWDVMMKENGDPAFAIENIVSAIKQLQKLPYKMADVEVLNDFTKLFSNLSLQKKNEKKMYSANLGFPWSHAQIFCDYIKYR